MSSFSFPAKTNLIFIIFTCVFLLGACTDNNAPNKSTSASVNTDIKKISSVNNTAETMATKPLLTVYKSPTCGCCEKWITHIDQHGFSSKAHNQADLSSFKMDKGIAPQYRSCHTAVSKEGYVFEGHVPAKFIHQFLASPPKDAIGLSVPAMPIGTPGMEVDDKFMPYRVILLNADGSYGIYAELNSYQEQF